MDVVYINGKSNLRIANIFEVDEEFAVLTYFEDTTEPHIGVLNMKTLNVTQ